MPANALKKWYSERKITKTKGMACCVILERNPFDEIVKNTRNFFFFFSFSGMKQKQEELFNKTERLFIRYLVEKKAGKQKKQVLAQVLTGR